MRAKSVLVSPFLEGDQQQNLRSRIAHWINGLEQSNEQSSWTWLKAQTLQMLFALFVCVPDARRMLQLFSLQQCFSTSTTLMLTSMTTTLQLMATFAPPDQWQLCCPPEQTQSWIHKSSSKHNCNLSHLNFCSIAEEELSSLVCARRGTLIKTPASLGLHPDHLAQEANDGII